VRKQCLKYSGAQSAAGLSRVEKCSSSSKIPIPISRPFSFTIVAEEIVIGSTFATKFQSSGPPPAILDLPAHARAGKFRVNKSAGREHCGLRVVALAVAETWFGSSAILVAFDDKSLTNGL
jgi:hypothetical protein